MAYQCPRCGERVSRSTRSGCLFGGGLVGAMLSAAFSPMECRNCGQIPTHEFHPSDRMSMRMGAFALVFGSIILLVVVIGVIVALNSKW